MFFSVFEFFTDADFDVTNFLCNNLPDVADTVSSSSHSSSSRSDDVVNNFLSYSSSSFLRPRPPILGPCHNS